VLHLGQVIAYACELLSGECEAASLQASTCSELFTSALGLVDACTEAHVDLLCDHAEAACAMAVRLLCKGSPRVCTLAGEVLVSLSKVRPATATAVQLRVATSLCSALRRRESELTLDQLSRMCRALASLHVCPSACAALLELCSSAHAAGLNSNSAAESARVLCAASALRHCAPASLSEHVRPLCDRVCEELAVVLAGLSPVCGDGSAAHHLPGDSVLVTVGEALLHTLDQLQPGAQVALREQLTRTVEQQPQPPASAGIRAQLSKRACDQLFQLSCAALAHGLAELAQQLFQLLMGQVGFLLELVFTGEFLL
jgi:hypothetical protein